MAQWNGSPRESGSLSRVLGTFDGIAILVGITIGSGIFRTPNKILGALGDPLLVLFAWVIGGAVTLLGSLTFAEIGSLHPETGGQFLYLRRAFGKRMGFLFGWAALVAFKPTSIAAIAVTFGDYAVRLVDPGSDTGDGGMAGRIAAAGCIALLTLVNITGVRPGALVQNLFTIGKLAALLFIVGAVAFSGTMEPSNFTTTLPRAEGRSLLAAFGVALFGVLWTYDGWADMSYMCGEVRNPSRTLKRIFIAGAAVVTLIYLLANAAYQLALAPRDLARSGAVAADTVGRVFSAEGARLAALFICVSTFGSINGSIMSGARIFFAMAREKLFFRAVAAVHPIFGTPVAAILLQSALAVILVFLQTFDQLIDSFTFTSFLFYGPAVASVFVFRRTMPDAPRPFRVPGYPFVPLLFLLATAAFLLQAFLSDIAEIRHLGDSDPATRKSVMDLEAMLSLAVLVAGLVVHGVWVRLAGKSAADAGGAAHSG